MKLKLDEVEVDFAGLEKKGTVPEWAEELKTHRSTLSDVAERSTMPDVVVLRVGNHQNLTRYERILRRISDRFSRSAPACRLVFDFHDEPSFRPESLSEAFGLLGRGNASRFEFSFGPEHLAPTVYEAIAKYIALTEESEASEEPGADPLSKAREVVEATRPLLAASGRISAKKVAERFGLSLSRLAELDGKQRQAVNKTPDSPRLQEFLRPFERVARLRAVFSDEDFRAWLRRPVRDLEDQSPLDLILGGRIEVVADYAEDMLLGTPA
jgi:hypothetical protein